MAPPSVPKHPHNKAPTADRLVAGGGFSLDDAQRQNAFARQDTLLYRAVRTLSAPLRPSTPRVRGLRRCPSARRPPFVAPQRQVRAPFGQVHAKNPHVLAKSPAFLSPPRRRARPHGRGTGEKFHIAAEKVRRNAHAFTFFCFCLLSMREKRAIFASKTCFINSAWQKRGRSSPFFISPPECSPPFLPSL